MDNLPNELCYQILALSLNEEGAIEFFAKNLPVQIVDEYGRGHGAMYRALRMFFDTTGISPIDRVGFIHWVKSETRIVDAIGGEDVLDEYFKEADNTQLSNARTSTALLRYHVNKARQAEKIEELAGLKDNRDDEDHAEDISRLIREIESLNRTESDPLKSVYDGNRIAENAEALWELPDFIPTPFITLNKAMGYSEESGFCKGAVHAILAQSGAGKSTFAKTLMNHWVENGYTCLYVNYEEAVAHWERVLFTQITKQNVYLAKTVNDTEKKHYTEIFREKMKEWNGRFLVKHDPDTPYFEDMEQWVREVAAKGTVPDVLFIDTIQSMFLKGGKNLPRWGQYEEMMVRLEKLAKDIGCAIIITAQENASRMKDKREVVQQSDIGGSIAIAQKSSVTIFITRAKLQVGDDSMDEHIMQLQIPKNRITGVSVMMDPPLVKYNDSIKSYEDFTLPPMEAYDKLMTGTDALLNPY